MKSGCFTVKKGLGNFFCQTYSFADTAKKPSTSKFTGPPTPQLASQRLGISCCENYKCQDAKIILIVKENLKMTLKFWKNPKIILKFAQNHKLTQNRFLKYKV